MPAISRLIAPPTQQYAVISQSGEEWLQMSNVFKTQTIEQIKVVVKKISV